uniref:Pe38 like protein n=1 Tax=Anticarsia gemmatalis multiple nucleopolyhedrovirus TaxID=268591 RepID=A0A0S3IV51_9ABAC|nr:pe38 like protein [Anticarsia gemmatalis multiple nucleopolyhedrovirus]ALR70444.1 pe38 like protein [Anticarsia gemmatalis multiple nucleopolyhedrovirus]ALR70758.1 pe38 like protein [Anticarsia gemmatalis multiple nucleopolyhedrovirus]ALR71701.1 pe38 like protein [Anticarsia gemmatalis multiple nucleopolyhedrovirus]
MSNRYTPYERQRNRQQLQKTLLESFRLKPVTTFGATCSICLETYMMQSNNISEFLMPCNSSCTHMFCYKCIMSMYSNVETARSNVNCPMCRKSITSWQAFFPNTSVSCKFTKKTVGNVPATKQFTDAVKILESRCAPTSEYLKSANTEARQMLREQLNNLNQENKTLQETLNRNKTQHEIAWKSSCAQISALQQEVQENNKHYANELCSKQLECDQAETKNRELENKNREVEGKNQELENKNRELEEKNRELEEKNCEVINKNRELKEKNCELEEKNRKVKDKNCELENWNRELTNKNNELENELEKKNCELVNQKPTSSASFELQDNDLLAQNNLLKTQLFLQSQLMENEKQNRELQDKLQAYELIVQEMKQQLEERGVSVDI